VKAVTEAEWDDCTDPASMLGFLLGTGAASDRKLRLFGVACSRRVWGSLDGLGRAAVEVAEAYADGRAGPEALRAARLACRSAGGSAAWYAAASRPAVAARNASLSAQAGSGAEPAELAALLRDIFDPFRTVTVDPPCVPSSVLMLARRAYDDHLLPEGTLDPALLGALAENLEATGCQDARLLGHLSGPGPHVRGCFALDAILDRS
jgi:hypothetical protein